MSPYPRYTREQDGRCKLSEHDIAKVQKRKTAGERITDIAHSLGLSRATVYYWTDPVAQAKAKRRSASHHASPDVFKRYRQRKREVMPDEWRQYQAERKRRYYQTHIAKQRSEA